jgi:hypothetical protein
MPDWSTLDHPHHPLSVSTMARDAPAKLVEHEPEGTVQQRAPPLAIHDRLADDLVRVRQNLKGEDNPGSCMVSWPRRPSCLILWRRASIALLKSVVSEKSKPALSDA